MCELSDDVVDKLLYGTHGEKIHLEYKREDGGGSFNAPFEGIVTNLERRYRETHSDAMKQVYEGYMAHVPCPECGGKRLKREALAVTVGDKSIAEVSDMSIDRARAFLANAELTERQKLIAKQVLKEIDSRLRFLSDVGLDYLTLSRSAGTLSGGEAQRIRLATQIGSSLMGVLYILDEPSIGLHQRDNARLLKTLKGLRDLGNTLIVVEHDEETMLQATTSSTSAPARASTAARSSPAERRRRSWRARAPSPAPISPAAARCPCPPRGASPRATSPCAARAPTT